jgi:murein DD-endopeptidase MepM/ murein hydrolase activator NlpD
MKTVSLFLSLCILAACSQPAAPVVHKGSNNYSRALYPEINNSVEQSKLEDNFFIESGETISSASYQNSRINDVEVSTLEPVTISKEKPIEIGSVIHPAASNAFIWPLRGTLLYQFGSYKNGKPLEGIGIKTQYREPVRAARGGIVAYAGNSIEGFGNMVIIRHTDNWVTAYGHADQLLVSKGDSITQGQVIGYAGRSGDADSPQLYFALRKQKKAVNPLDHLPK